MSKTRRAVNRRGKRKQHSKRKSSLSRNLAGKIIVLIQLLMSIGFVGAVWYSALIPGAYLAALSGMLLLLFGALFGLQFIRSKAYIAGVIISVLISMLLGVGIFYMVRTRTEKPRLIWWTMTRAEARI